MTLDGTDAMSNGRILLDVDGHVAGWWQQGALSVIIWTGISNQTITEQFKIDEAVKLNLGNYWDFKEVFFTLQVESS